MLAHGGSVVNGFIWLPIPWGLLVAVLGAVGRRGIEGYTGCDHEFQTEPAEPLLHLPCLPNATPEPAQFALVRGFTLGWKYDGGAEVQAKGSYLG